LFVTAEPASVMSFDRPLTRPLRLAFAALTLSVLFSIGGQLLMKWAAIRTLGVAPDWTLLAPLMLALFVYSLGVVNWMIAVRELPLSIAYPITSLNYVGILAGSHYWFGETITPLRAVGVALVFCGVLMVALRAPGAQSAAAAVRETAR